jgi:hypothetical protein
MSESLSVVKESPEDEKDSAPNSKDPTNNRRGVIATGLMTALTTVAVSFIAIVPQMRRGDVEQYEKLQHEFNIFREKAAAPAPPIVPDKKLNIKGTVKSEAGGRPLAGVEVFLLPDGNNLLTTKTDDSGRFNLPGIPAGTYSIIIRDSTQGKSGKVLLDESENEIPVTMMGAKINYLIR